MSDWDETFSDQFISTTEDSNSSNSNLSDMSNESDFMDSSIIDERSETDIISLIDSPISIDSVNSEPGSFHDSYEAEFEDSNNPFFSEESEQEASQYEYSEEEDRHIFSDMRDTNDASDNLNASNNNCNTNLECNICFQSSIPNEPTMTLCGHVFCKRCIGRALERKKECPICRKKLQFKDVNRIYL